MKLSLFDRVRVRVRVRVRTILGLGLGEGEGCMRLQKGVPQGRGVIAVIGQCMGAENGLAGAEDWPIRVRVRVGESRLRDNHTGHESQKALETSAVHGCQNHSPSA